MKVPYRSVICSPPGKSLLALDLSAAESWVVAHLAQDDNMKRELRSGDLHSFAACIIADIPIPPGEGKARYKPFVDDLLRYSGKKTNHSSSYRIGAYTLCEDINKDGKITVSLWKVKQWHHRWHNTFRVRHWWSEIEENLQLNNRTLVTTYKRKRKFYGIWGDKLFKEATAYEPQSTVADHMRGRIHPEFGIEGGVRGIHKAYSKYAEIKLIQTAHDSILMEVPDEIVDEVGANCKALLSRPLVVKGETFTIPVDCDIYPKRWGENKRSLRAG